MSSAYRSTAERILRVPVRDEYWDRLFELAQDARQDPRDWAASQLERIVRRNMSKKPVAEVA
jgi:hypothetical protein